MLLELLHSVRPCGAPQGKGVGAGSLELWIGSGGITLLPAVGGPGCTEQRPHASQMLAARHVQGYWVPAAASQSPASLLVLIRLDQGEVEWGVYEPPAACLVLSMAGMRLMKQFMCPGCLLHLEFPPLFLVLTGISFKSGLWAPAWAPTSLPWLELSTHI